MPDYDHSLLKINYLNILTSLTDKKSGFFHMYLIFLKAYKPRGVRKYFARIQEIITMIKIRIFMISSSEIDVCMLDWRTRMAGNFMTRH